MTDTSASPLLNGAKRPPAPGVRCPSQPASEGAPPIEIVSPDSNCTALLLEYAADSFPAEVVSGSGRIVRLQPPAGEGWVLELLSVVERWLESTRLPSATVVYAGRSYLIRAESPPS